MNNLIIIGIILRFIALGLFLWGVFPKMYLESKIEDQIIKTRQMLFCLGLFTVGSISLMIEYNFCRLNFCLLPFLTADIISLLNSLYFVITVTILYLIYDQDI